MALNIFCERFARDSDVIGSSAPVWVVRDWRTEAGRRGVSAFSGRWRRDRRSGWEERKEVEYAAAA